MEVVPAARRRLLAEAGVRGYVQDRVFKHKLLEHVDQKGTRAIVLRTNGGWAEPDRTQSTEYPVLVLDCWADCDRDEHGDKVAENAIDNAWAVFRVADRVLHRVRGEFWGGTNGLMVIESKRWTEPDYQTKDDAHAGIIGGLGGVELGEAAAVTVQYALMVSH